MWKYGTCVGGGGANNPHPLGGGGGGGLRKIRRKDPTKIYENKLLATYTRTSSIFISGTEEIQHFETRMLVFYEIRRKTHF